MLLSLLRRAGIWVDLMFVSVVIVRWRGGVVSVMLIGVSARYRGLRLRCRLVLIFCGAVAFEGLIIAMGFSFGNVSGFVREFEQPSYHNKPPLKGVDGRNAPNMSAVL